VSREGDRVRLPQARQDARRVGLQLCQHHRVKLPLSCAVKLRRAWSMLRTRREAVSNTRGRHQEERGETDVSRTQISGVARGYTIAVNLGRNKQLLA
jgi:hypothetical protein